MPDPKDGVAVVGEDQVPEKVKAYFDELADKLAGKLNQPAESRAQFNAQPTEDPDDPEVAERAQVKAANRFRFTDAIRAARKGDDKTLTKMGVKAGAEGTGSSGGYLVPEFYLTDRWVDVFRNAAVARQLGLTILTMPTRIEHVAKLTADVAVSWGAENSTLTASDPTYSQVNFTAKKQYAYAIVSNELLADSNPAVEQIIRTSIAKAIAVDETKQVLIGDGTGATPTGVLNTGSIGSVSLGTNGATPTFDNMIDAIYTLELANVPPPFAFAWHARVKQSLRKAKNSQGTYLWDIDEPSAGSPGMVEGYPFAQTNVFSITLTQGSASNSTTALVGNWENGWLMERQDMEWLVSNTAGTAFQADQTWFRVTRRMDFGVVRPTAFASIVGILP